VNSLLRSRRSTPLKLDSDPLSPVCGSPGYVECAWSRDKILLEKRFLYSPNIIFSVDCYRCQAVWTIFSNSLLRDVANCLIRHRICLLFHLRVRNWRSQAGCFVRRVCTPGCPPRARISIEHPVPATHVHQPPTASGHRQIAAAMRGSRRRNGGWAGAPAKRVRLVCSAPA